jgi:hypothetical protein
MPTRNHVPELKMVKLTKAGIVAAALVLAGTGTLAAQDTSYTRTPLPSDTSFADTSAVDRPTDDSIVSDSASDTLRTDVSPTDTTAAAATAEPYQSPGKAKKAKSGDEATATTDDTVDTGAGAGDSAAAVPDRTKP